MHRTSRIVGAVLGSALLVLTHSTPAAAATVVTTGLPEGWTVYSAGCQGGDGGGGTVGTVSGPSAAAPPLGTGSLRLRQQDQAGIIGVVTEVGSLAGVTDLSVSYFDPSESTYAVVYLPEHSWQGEVLLRGTTWSEEDLLQTTFTWRDFNALDPGQGEEATVPEFISWHGDGSAQILIARAVCSDGAVTPSSTYLDNLTFGVGDTSKTYDFEAGVQKASLTMTVKDDTIRRGDNVVVSGTVDPVLPGATILLKRRTADGPKKIGSGVIAQNGSYRIVKELNTKGTYKLFTSVAATATTTAAKSPIRTVTVRR